MQARLHKRRAVGRNRMAAPASKSHGVLTVDPLASLRANIQTQIRQWAEQLCECNGRAESIEMAVRARIDALLRERRPPCADPARAAKAAWSELEELRAGAFRADNLARNAYQHELKDMQESIRTRRTIWQREIRLLHANPEQFWDEVLNGDLQPAWQRLIHLMETNGDAWRGFGSIVEQNLGSETKAGEERKQT